MKHQHRAVKGQTVTRGFSGPVSDRPNPAAHGNVCYIDHCRCGATRRTNVNQWYRERGQWSEFLVLVTKGKYENE